MIIRKYIILTLILNSNSNSNSNSKSSKKVHTVTIVIASVIGGFALIVAAVLLIKNIRKRGGVRKITIDIKRHFVTQV